MHSIPKSAVYCDNCEKEVATIHCITCDGALCDACNEICHSQKITQQHIRGPILEKQSMICMLHGEPMKMYCNQCGVLVCRDCGDFGEHKGHVLSLLDKIVEKHRTEIKTLTIQAAAVVSQLEAVLQQVNHTLHYLGISPEDSELSGTSTEGLIQVNEHFDELVSSVEDRRTFLISKVKTLSHEKETALAAQSSILQRLLANCKDTLYHSKIAVRATDSGLASSFASVRESLENCLAIDMSLHLQPATDSHMCISLPDTLLRAVKHHGSVGGPSPPIDVTCYLRNSVVVITWRPGYSSNSSISDGDEEKDNHHLSYAHQALPPTPPPSCHSVTASMSMVASSSMVGSGDRRMTISSISQSHGQQSQVGSCNHNNDALAALISASKCEAESDLIASQTLIPGKVDANELEEEVEFPHLSETYVIQQTIYPETVHPDPSSHPADNHSLAIGHDSSPIVSDVGRTKKNVTSYELDATGLNSCRLSFRILAVDENGNSSFLSQATEIIIPDILAQKLDFVKPFDENGLFFWIGTMGHTKPYTNPHTSGAVVAALSNIGGYLSSSPHKIVGRTADGFNFTSDQPNSWMGVDLGPKRRLIPDHYCIRSDQSPRKPCNWELQAMVGGDNGEWITLRRHENDLTFAEDSHSVGHWTLNAHVSPSNCDYDTPFRYFRIFQFGKNTGKTDHLVCCGLELYGSYIELP